MLRRESDSVIDDNVLIALTDHISMVLEREQAGIICDNPLLFEIKRFYGREFELALKAREIIRGHLGIEISEAEVGFIALHIVNATMKQRADHLMLSIKMINGILNTVYRTLGSRMTRVASNTSAFCATSSSSPSACSTRASRSPRTPSYSTWVKTST